MSNNNLHLGSNPFYQPSELSNPLYAEPEHNLSTNAHEELTPKNEEIKLRSKINDFIITNIFRPFKPILFDNSWFLKRNQTRPIVQAGRMKLQAIGGKELKLKTADGDVIDGMHITARDFKEKLDKFFDFKEVKIKGKSEKRQYLVLKKEFVKNGKVSDEADTFCGILESCGLKLDSKNDKFTIKIPASAKMKGEKKESSDDSISTPTAIICGAQAINYSFYKGTSVSLLLRGIDVVLFDYRGTGESTGSPTLYKTKLDIEACYKYLSEDKKIENKDIIAYGHCFGGPVAADLAARKEGVNLIVDRSFAYYNEMAASQYPKVKRIINKIFPKLFTYDVNPNIPKVTGNLAIIRDLKDDTIPEEQIVKNIDAVAETPQERTIKVITSDIGHSSNWLTCDSSNELGSEQLDDFLTRANLSRGLFS